MDARGPTRALAGVWGSGHGRCPFGPSVLGPGSADPTNHLHTTSVTGTDAPERTQHMDTDAEKVKGKAKEIAGKVTGSDEWAKEGQAQQEKAEAETQKRAAEDKQDEHSGA